MNFAMLLGRVGSKDVRDLGEGNQVVNLRLATTDRWKTKEGEQRERTEWHNIALFGQNGAFAKEYINVGDLIRVCGNIRTRKWVTQDRETKYITELAAQGKQGEVEIIQRAQSASDDPNYTFD